MAVHPAPSQATFPFPYIQTAFQPLDGPLLGDGGGYSSCSQGHTPQGRPNTQAALQAMDGCLRILLLLGHIDDLNAVPL